MKQHRQFNIKKEYFSTSDASHDLAPLSPLPCFPVERRYQRPVAANTRHRQEDTDAFDPAARRSPQNHPQHLISKAQHTPSCKTSARSAPRGGKETAVTSRHSATAYVLRNEILIRAADADWL